MSDSEEPNNSPYTSTWDTIAAISNTVVASLVTYSVSFEQQEQSADIVEEIIPFSGHSIDSSLSSVDSGATPKSIDHTESKTNQSTYTSPSSVTFAFTEDMEPEPRRTMDKTRLESIQKRVSREGPRQGGITVEILQTVVGDETDYVINLSTKNSIFWNVSYRFSYFRILRDFVEANVATEMVAVFPGVFPLSWIMNMQQAQLAVRQQQLWEWITELFSKYSTFSRVVKQGISAFFNGSFPDHRLEKYLIPFGEDRPDDVCDRCYVTTSIMDIKDHPTYVITVNSIWRQNWEVHYRFNSFRILNNFIVDRFPKMICFEFPRTHTRSSYGMKLPIKELVERHVHLKFWVSDVLACFPLFPDEIQDEMNMFFEGHPKYEPIAIYRKVNGEMVRAKHSDMEGKFSFCTNPVTGVDMLLDDYGLSDEALEKTNGRVASSKLLDIVAFLQLPDNVAFEITRFSAVQSKIIFADQLLKWAEIKMDVTFKNARDTLTDDQQNERDEIEAALESFFDCVYKISTLPDDDLDITSPDAKKTTRLSSPGNSLYVKTRDYQYSGMQLIAGKIASTFYLLTMVEDAVYSAAYACLEKILDTGVSLASYSIIGGKKNSAASVRTATCVSLLGEVATIGPHLPFIDNAESVFQKILIEGDASNEKIPASLKYVAAVMKQLMESEKIRVGTETSSKQLEKTKSQIEEAEDEYRKVLSRKSPGVPGVESDGDTVRVGNKALRKEAIDALFEVLSAGDKKPASRRSTMAGAPEASSPPRPKKALRRLSTDDNMLLRLAHYGANADKFTSGEFTRTRSGSVEQDLASSPTRSPSLKPFEHSPVSNIRDMSMPAPDLDRPSQAGPATKRGSLTEVYHNELEGAFNYLVKDEKPDPQSGEKRLKLQKLLDWDQVQAVLANGDLTADDVTAEFNKLATTSFFGGGGSSSIDFDSFCILMETLESS